MKGYAWFESRVPGEEWLGVDRCGDAGGRVGRWYSPPNIGRLSCRRVVSETATCRWNAGPVVALETCRSLPYQVLQSILHGPRGWQWVVVGIRPTHHRNVAIPAGKPPHQALEDDGLHTSAGATREHECRRSANPCGGVGNKPPGNLLGRRDGV